MRSDSFRISLLGGVLFCLLPFVNASIALLLGIAIALVFRGKVRDSIQERSSLVLKISIVIMGFGMNLSTAITTSWTGIGLTFLTVFLTLVLGLLLGKLLRVNQNTTTLISVGTAICGGSAIAAMSPVIQAKSEQMSFAIIVIFLFNAVALMIFPVLGELLDMSQTVFGKWAAIAIHDTSSVVGAGSTFGNEALEVATTLKLTRALWIVPVTLVFAFFQKDCRVKPKFPWFILLFVLAMVVVHYFPVWDEVFQVLNVIGKKGMLVALFLIGSTFSVSEIQEVGMRPFLLGLFLWVLIGTGSLISLWRF